MPRMPRLFYEDPECQTCPIYEYNDKVDEWGVEPIHPENILYGDHVIIEGVEKVRAGGDSYRNLKSSDPVLWDGVSIPEMAELEEIDYTEDEAEEPEEDHPHATRVG